MRGPCTLTCSRRLPDIFFGINSIGFNTEPRLFCTAAAFILNVDDTLEMRLFFGNFRQLMKCLFGVHQSISYTNIKIN